MKRLRRKRRGNQKGVTLFEVMLALALFAEIIVPIMQSFMTSMKVNKRARETMIATDIAQSIMEGFAGKTYYQVWKAITIAPNGFDYSTEEKIEQSGKYALTTINDCYYNCNTAAHNRVYKTLFPASVKNAASTYAYTGAIPFDQFLTQDAYTTLQANAPGALQPFVNTWTNNGDDTDDVFTPDKCLYYGCSDSHYADSQNTPIMAYLVYTRIEKDNQYFDATVTFAPKQQNLLKKDSSDPNEVDKFFTYEVIVKVYPYKYDPKVGDFVERFDPATNFFEGSPAAVLVSGIQNRDPKLDM